MDDESAVLAANNAFYVAFATGDIEAMGRLWADRPQVSCVHPGWAPLFGRAEVMASWRAVLAKPPAVTVDEARVALHGAAAVVLCRERIGKASLSASNVLVRTADGWKIVHHQSGPMAPQEQTALVLH